MRKAPKNTQSYIAGYPSKTRALLKKLRATIKTAAPGAKERISYGIPSYYLRRAVVHFAGYNGHIGFYPGSAAIRHFKKDLKKYKTAKGTVQFPLDKPIPVALVRRIVKFRIALSK